MNALHRTRIKYPLCLILLIALLTGPQAAFASTPKSPKVAALLSVLLPGAGELYAGGPRSARFFLFTEGLFWTGLIAFRTLNSTRENTFKSFAAAHAGAQTEGKPNSYFDELVLYRSIYDRNARERYLQGDLAQLRPETPINIWEWDSNASRAKFQDLRSKATWARTRSLLFVGALIFNRFASAVNAAHIASKTRLAPPRAIEVGFTPGPNGRADAWLMARF